MMASATSTLHCPTKVSPNERAAYALSFRLILVSTIFDMNIS